MGRRRLLRLCLFGLVVVAALLLGSGGSARSDTSPNPIQVENAKPGTPGWDDFASIAQQDAISGFGSKISVNHGDSLDLYVTTTAASFTIDIFRVGWYGGVGARLIESLGTFPGVHQAIPPPDPVTGMVSCDNWTKTTTLSIPSDWVTGVYLAKLSASSGNKSFIMFVVRNDGGTEPVVFQSSVTTSQAYNLWGGVSLYDNRTNKAIYKYPAATKVTFDRPFDPLDGNGAGQFFAFEYPFVRWAESQGYDMTYITDVDTNTNVNPLTNHRVFLSVGHDEYWSKGMRDNVADAISHGVNAAFFSANSMYWQIRFEPNAEGVPNRVQVGYKDSATSNSPPGPDPQWNVNNSIVTTRWRDAPVNNPENGLIGVMYQDQVQKDYAYVVQNSTNWIYAGTGFTDGTSIPGIVGYEYDKVWNNGASPPGLTVLSNSPVVGCCEGSGNSFSNSTLYTAPSGAQVFASGTIQWSWGLDNYSAHYANAGIQRTTANILDRFSSGATTPAPAVSLIPSSLSFGQQGVGTTSASKSSTLTNVGTAPLTLSGVALAGANPGDFSEVNTCPLAPATLAPNASCLITVSFTPSANGARAGAIQLTDDSSDSPQSLPLSGTGVVPAPAVSLTPAGLSFGSLIVGQSSSMQASVVKNTGSAPLTISSIAAGGANAGDFSVGSDCPVAPETLAAGATCAINVVFQPTATGQRSATVQVVDDAAGSPQSVALDGTGVSATPAVTLTPASLSFAEQTVGTTSTAQSVAVRNSGGGPLTITSISLGGANPSDYASTSGCPIAPATLAPNATCAVSVTFTPSATGTRSATLQITDDAPASPQSIPVSGTGGSPAAVALDKSLGTKTENVGGSSMTLTTNAAALTQTRVALFVVWNSGTATLNSVSGGGLTWSVDVQTKDGNNDHVAIASADAALGLASGTVLTATFSGSVTHGLIAAASFTGLAPGTPADASASRTQAGVAAWNAPLTVPNANDLVVGFSVVDANATDTPTAPNAEIHDFGDVNYYGWATSVYQVAASAGAVTVGGTWSRTGGTANGTVVAAYKAGAAASPAPAVSLTPASLSFGAATVGVTTPAQSSMLKNTGTAALSISSITAAGTDAADFVVSNNCPASLAAGASCSVTVAFTPGATGARSGIVQVADSASDSPQSIALNGTGTAPAPAVTLTPSSLAFGSVGVGAASSAQASTVKNTGTGPLTISGITVAGTNAGDFAQTNTCPATLAAGASCEIDITFTPSANGARSASVKLTDNATDSPQSVTLSGTGLAPAVILDPASLSFGSQTTGTTSAPQSSTLTNSGNAPLNITSVAVVGESGADFAQTNTCPPTLAAGASCTISATFTPSATVARSAGIRIADDAADSPQVLGLSGTGVAPAPGASLSPNSLSFGSILVGSSSAVQSVTLTNTGAGTLSISSVSITGANAADFSSTMTCGTTLAAGAACSIDVTFAPGAAGGRSATLQVADDAPGSPQSVGLTGTGATPAPDVSLSPTSLPFGSQRVGTTSATQAIVLTNTGNAPLTISGIAVAGTNSGDFAIVNSTCPAAPATLGAGVSCNVVVSFTPSATGSRGAALQVTDDAAGSPHGVGLSGTGIAPAVSLSPTSISFGSVLLGSSGTQSATVTNSGTAALAISSITITGPNAGDFSLGGAGCPSSLAAGSACTLQVTFQPGATGARSASVSIADDAAGSPHSLPLSGAGSTSAIAFDANLGTKSENVGGANMKLVTAGTAAAGSRIFLFVEWNNSTRVLSSVSGGGLTWHVDYQAKGVNNNHLAIASASAPSGLATGVTLTAGFSGSVTHGLIAAASFTGVAAALDGTVSATGSGGRTWSASVTTAAAPDLVLGFSTIDANSTDAATAPNVEIHDFGNSAYYAWSTTVYQVTGAGGQATVAGTWAANAGATANLTIAVAYRGS